MNKGNSHFDALIFDLGKVIIDFDSTRALQKLEGRTPLVKQELILKLKSLDTLNRFECGELTSDAFYVELARELQLEMSFEEFRTVWSDVFAKESILDESFFARLKNHYRLLLLSNTNSMHTEFLMAHFPMLHIFDHRILSFRVGAMKPNHRIFLAAQQAAQTAPERIFYVDDMPGYVEAASRLGWNAVQFIGKDPLIRDMKARGISFE